MKDEKKTKKELIDELRKLRRKVSSLEKTESKRTEDALRRSERKLRNILQTANEGFWLIDNKGNTVDVNKTMCKLMKAPKSSMIGRNVTDFLDEENKILFKEQMKAGTEGKSVSHEAVFTRLDGSKVHCRINCSPLHNESGKKSGSFAMITDISDRKKAELELKESEERYRTSIEHANDGFIFVEDGKIIFSNQKFLSIFGYHDFDDIRNKPFTIFLDPEDRLTVMDIYGRRLKGEPAPSRYECNGIRQDGQQIDVEISSAITTLKGRAVTIAFVRDVTERKIKDDIVRRSEAQLLATVNSLPYDFFAIDEEGRYFLQNEKCVENWGNIIGKRPEDLGVPEEIKNIWLKNNKLAFKGETVEGEVMFNINGVPKYFHNIISPIISKTKVTGIMGINIDITDRKKSGDALRASEEKLKLLFDSTTDAIFILDMKGNFIDINRTAHERLGYSREEMLALSLSELDPPEYADRVPERLEMIRKNGYAIFESGHERKDGTVMPVEINSRILDYDGKKVIISVIRDLTERKKNEDAIRESEERFRSLVESTSDWIWEVDSDGRYVYASPQIKSILGYDPDEILGKTPFDLMPSDEARKIAAQFEDIAGKREAFSMLENINKHKNGDLVVLETSGVPIIDSDGTLRGYRGVDRNISKRKEAELQFISLFEDSPVSLWLEDLSDVKARIDELKEKGIDDLHAYFNEHPDEVLACASRIKVIDVNRSALDLYNARSKKELIANLGKTFREESREAIKTGLIAIADRKRSIELETITQTMNGAKVFSSIRWSVVPGYEDTFSRVLVSITDITSQKLTEEMLRQREQMYRMLVESTSALAWEFDLAAMHFTYVSPQAEFITGYPAVEWTDFDFWAGMIIPEDRDWASNYCMTETQKGNDHEFEYRIKTAYGKIVWLRDIVTVIKDNDKPVKLRGFMFDVSERKNMEEEIRKGKNLESLGILAGGIAHDFNNLLTSILGNISLAQSFASPDDRISERLTIAENASLRAKDLTRQLLTFSRGGTPVKKVVFISNIIKDSSSFALSGSNVRCKYSLPDDLRPVEIDEGQIGQVIHNLVINARDAMPEGGTITINGRNATVTGDNNLSLSAGDYVQISVTDEGVGISNDNISRVFDPYFTTKDMGVQKGMGLGLAICHSIIKSHDGTIMVESEIERGTTFHLYLPAKEQDRLKKLREESVELKDVTGSGRILIMDDEEILRDIVRVMLEEIGYEVEAAADGISAVQMYKNADNEGCPYDAVILDLTVPGAMGGKGAIKELLAIDPDVKAIVSSGYGNDPVISNYKDYGFKGYIIKPYKIEELGIILKNILRN